MSKITDDGSTQSATECFIAVGLPIRQQWASKGLGIALHVFNGTVKAVWLGSLVPRFIERRLRSFRLCWGQWVRVSGWRHRQVPWVDRLSETPSVAPSRRRLAVAAAAGSSVAVSSDVPWYRPSPCVVDRAAQQRDKRHHLLPVSPWFLYC